MNEKNGSEPEVPLNLVSGLGGKMGLDATHNGPGETSCEWRMPIVMDNAVKARVGLGLGLVCRHPVGD